MDRLIFTAMSGLSESMVQQRVIASNMANTQTTGFRAEMLATTPVSLQQASTLQARAMTQSAVHGADMRAGTISSTGNPLDIAVQGNDLIAVAAPDGSEAYTRRGDLSVSSTGVLQNGEGLAVIGGSGPITVPTGSSVSIGPDGSVLVASTQPGLPPQVVDKIKLVSPDGSKIAKNLTGQIVVVGGGALPADEAAKVAPASLEQSNVNPNQVLVAMLSAQRLFDIRTKLVSTAKDVDQSGASLMHISAS